MAILIKRKKLFNPGRLRKRANSRRKLSAKQIKFFGTARQRAALKRRKPNGKSSRAAARIQRRYRPSKRRRNVGEIITLDLVRKTNSGRKRKNTMAKRRRINSSRRRTRRANTGIRRRTRRNRGTVIRRRRRNTTIRRRRRNSGLVRRRRRNRGVRVARRRRNYGRVSRRRLNSGRYRRNPGFTSAAMKGISIVAGMFTTGKLVSILSGYSSSLASGPTNIAATAAIALLQGWAIKKFTGKAELAENIAIGGIALAVVKALNAYAPQFSPSLSGLGLIGGSSFTYPQVNVPGKSGTFLVAPDYQNAINSAIAASQPKMVAGGMRGIYPQNNGGGRGSLKRVGRFS